MFRVLIGQLCPGPDQLGLVNACLMWAPVLRLTLEKDRKPKNRCSKLDIWGFPWKLGAEAPPEPTARHVTPVTHAAHQLHL